MSEISIESYGPDYYPTRDIALGLSDLNKDTFNFSDIYDKDEYCKMFDHDNLIESIELGVRKNSGNLHIMVAIDNTTDHVLSALLVNFEPEHAHEIVDMATLRIKQRQGLATMLYQKFEEISPSKIQKLFTQKDTTAYGLYKKWGFSVEQEVEGYPGYVFMYKNTEII